MVGFGGNPCDPYMLTADAVCNTEASWQPPQIARRASTMSDDQTAGWGGFFQNGGLGYGWSRLICPLRNSKFPT